MVEVKDYILTRYSMCAGVTTFKALRPSGALPGDLVAVEGIGGLGHLFATVGRGAEHAALAKKIGAHVCIDNSATDAAADLQNSAAHSSIRRGA
jgi:D-arabinose 1-dehydrogenase-like Zn-dependent alcohol dehydrogenase